MHTGAQTIRKSILFLRANLLRETKSAFLGFNRIALSVNGVHTIELQHRVLSVQSVRSVYRFYSVENAFGWVGGLVGGSKRGRSVVNNGSKRDAFFLLTEVFGRRFLK